MKTLTASIPIVFASGVPASAQLSAQRFSVLTLLFTALTLAGCRHPAAVIQTPSVASPGIQHVNSYESRVNSCFGFENPDSGETSLGRSEHAWIGKSEETWFGHTVFVSSPQIGDAEDSDIANVSCSPYGDSVQGSAAEFIEPEMSFKDERTRFFALLRKDARGVANWNNAAILGGALAGAIVLRQDLDDQVRRNTNKHPERWGSTSKAIGKLGEPQYHIAAVLGLYGLSLHRQDEELHDLSVSLISAYALTGLSTVAVKAIANTDRPSSDWNGGQFGFPSFHASSAFTMAAVLDEYHGPKAGLPAYALAGLVGWSRIDERDHDLSDVVFGAAMGYVIGKSVAGQHLRGDPRVRLLPYTHPTEGTSGVKLEWEY